MVPDSHAEGDVVLYRIMVWQKWDYGRELVNKRDRSGATWRPALISVGTIHHDRG